MLTALKCECHETLHGRFKVALSAAALVQTRQKESNRNRYFVTIPRLGFKAADPSGNTDTVLEVSHATICHKYFSRRVAKVGGKH